MGSAPGWGTLVKMASGQGETAFIWKIKKEMVGFGQGARLGNFGEDGVGAKRVNSSFGMSKRKLYRVGFGHGAQLGNLGEDGV